MNEWKYIFCWVMEWWHLLGLIISMLKSSKWRHSIAALGLGCNTRHCHWKKIKTSLLPCLCKLQMSKVPMWRVILNKDLGLCCFTRAISESFTSEYGKIQFSASLDNGKFNLLLSFKGRKYNVCKGRMGLEILYGFCRASQIHCCNVRASIAVNRRLLVPWSILG